MASKLFNYIFQRTPPKPVRIPNFPYKAEQNPYRAKREWPPDFDTLSRKHRFSFEKRFKRRSRMKYINPTWNKWTKIIQWSLITFVAVYSVFFVRLNHEPLNGSTYYEYIVETLRMDPETRYEKWLREKGSKPGIKLDPEDEVEYKRLMERDNAKKIGPPLPSDRART